jgi:hypothetical protein
MTIHPTDLETPERGLTRSIRRRTPEVEPPAHEDAVAELAALRARIEAARTVEPTPRERHCRDCFNKGRNAAIRAIESPKTT